VKNAKPIVRHHEVAIKRSCGAKNRVPNRPGPRGPRQPAASAQRSGRLERQIPSGSMRVVDQPDGTLYGYSSGRSPTMSSVLPLSVQFVRLRHATLRRPQRPHDGETHPNVPTIHRRPP